MKTNRQIVEQVYAAFHRKDIPGLVRLVGPDVEIAQTDQLPWGGRHRGVDGLIDFVSILTARIESEVEIAELFEAGDRVIQIGRTRGRVRWSERAFDIREIHVWRLREGKVASFESYIDTPAMLTALETV